jgi:rhodanese-related sulfurtransferase
MCAIFLKPFLSKALPASWMDEPEWEVNPRFCHAVSALLVDRHDPLNTEIILICRSGKRSLDAGNALLKKGFKNIAHITTGFEGQ